MWCKLHDLTRNEGHEGIVVREIGKSVSHGGLSMLLASRIGELSMLSFTVQSTYSPRFTSIASLAF